MIPSTAFRSEEPFTQKQFRRWVESRPRADINHYELLNGRIVMTPPAGWTHGQLDARLTSLLDEHVRRHALGIVFGSSTGYDLPSGDTVEPDVSFVSRERFTATPPTRPDEFLRLVPNLVVEILSPATAKRDRTEKKEIYERNGVAEYWIVDPRAKTLSVFHLTEGRYGEGRSHASGTVRSRVLPKLRLSVANLFAR
jgi:Uma2 family endonuclease